MIAIGSTNPVSRNQLAHLSPLVDQTVTIDSESASVAPEDAAREAVASLDPNGRMETVVVTSTLSGSWISREWAPRVAESIAVAVRILHESAPYDGFILTGGDTAVKVARTLGTTGIVLESELSAGIPIGAFEGPTRARVITKAGGFGDSATLIAALKHLIGERTTKESVA